LDLKFSVRVYNRLKEEEWLILLDKNPCSQSLVQMILNKDYACKNMKAGLKHSSKRKD
jgi:hypothetical protein